MWKDYVVATMGTGSTVRWKALAAWAASASTVLCLVLAAGTAKPTYSERRATPALRSARPRVDAANTRILERTADTVTVTPEESLLEVGELEEEEEEYDDDDDGSGVHGRDSATKRELEQDLSCSPLHVTGLQNCSSWRGANIVSGLLTVKREMLKSVVQVLADPKSSGPGGDPQSPLLLVQKLAVDEVDAVTGASSPVYIGKATDATGWSPELGGMNRWLARYHREVLGGARPVAVHVHGDDTCALEKEVSRTARAMVAGEPSEYPESTATRQGGSGGDERRGAWEDEDFDVPLALMTFGWDPAGDPTQHVKNAARDVECTMRLLDLDRVVVWLTSHRQPDSRSHPKLKYVPIGFGGWETRNGLPQSVYLEKAQRRLRTMEECAFSNIGRYDLLFECNTLDRRARADIWREMTTTEGQPIPVNHCPLPPNEMVRAAATGIFAVSPPGTGPDCFRHYEMMAEGNIALVPDDDSLRLIMEDLPAFFLGKEVPWSGLSCDRLVHMAYVVEEMMKSDNGGLRYEKLTHGYWRNYIRETLLEAAGYPPGSPYPERSADPLDPPAWNTFRRMDGCFQRKGLEDDVFVSLETTDDAASICATFCTTKGDASAAGTGFFGVTTDNTCWCSNHLGEIVADELCEHPVACGDSSEDKENRDCLPYGSSRGEVFVFGPPDKPLDYIYHGCYREHERFLYSAKQKFSHVMTPGICGAYCFSLRYAFFGVERGTWCRCGTMARNAGTSLREPAWADDAGPHLDLGTPDAAMAALPYPGAVVGDPNFQCDMTCSGDDTIKGCGGQMAWDLYSVAAPCVLFRDCDEDVRALI